MSTAWPEIPFLDAFSVAPKNTETLPRSSYMDSGDYAVVDQGEELIGGWSNDAAMVRTFERPVIVFGDHTRCLKYIDFPFIPGADGTKILVPATSLDPRFAYFQLRAAPIEGKGYARHFGELKKRAIKVPPLNEQQRIVAQIEKAIAAISGLERGTLESHRLVGEVSRSQLATLLNRAGGELETLDAVATVDYGDRVVRARDGGTKYPVYGGGGATFSIDRTNRRDCFIVSRFGMSETCVRYVDGEFFLNDSGLSVATRDEATLRQAYLDRVLLSRQPEIYSLGTGTAQKNLDVTKFKQLSLTIPKPQVQDKLVSEYDAASAVCVAAEQVYARRADKCIDLTKSVLEAAFRGEL